MTADQPSAEQARQDDAITRQTEAWANGALTDRQFYWCMVRYWFGNVFGRDRLFSNFVGLFLIGSAIYWVQAEGVTMRSMGLVAMSLIMAGIHIGGTWLKANASYREFVKKRDEERAQSPR